MNLSLFSNSLQVVSQVPCPLRLPDNNLYFSTNPPQLVYLFFKSHYAIFYSCFSTSFESFSRKEIELTLDKLKTIEKNLTVKERELCRVRVIVQTSVTHSN